MTGPRNPDGVVIVHRRQVPKVAARCATTLGYPHAIPFGIGAASGEIKCHYLTGAVTKVNEGRKVSLGEPPQDAGKAWLAVIRP